jgi:hypothetical protein
VTVLAIEQFSRHCAASFNPRHTDGEFIGKEHRKFGHGQGSGWFMGMSAEGLPLTVQ